MCTFGSDVISIATMDHARVFKISLLHRRLVALGHRRPKSKCYHKYGIINENLNHDSECHEGLHVVATDGGACERADMVKVPDHGIHVTVESCSWRSPSIHLRENRDR